MAVSILSASLPVTEERLVDVKKGDTLPHVASRLNDEGVFTHPLLFRIMARMTGGDRSIRVGSYKISPGDSAYALWRKMARGEVVEIRVTLPEGISMRQVAQLLAERKIAAESELLAAMRDREFLRSAGFDGVSFEGYLFPATYSFGPRTDARQAVLDMARKMQSVLYEELGLSKDTPLREINRILTLASLVEKEAKDAREMGMIASVFANRLKIGMRLQCDPTIIYGLPGFDGNIRKRDILNPHPYNTYVHAGLPPGPIASPSKQAIQAARTPASTDFLYFVARNDGTHQFSRTLHEHDRAVNRFQRNRRG